VDRVWVWIGAHMCTAQTPTFTPPWGSVPLSPEFALEEEGCESILCDSRRGDRFSDGC